MIETIVEQDSAALMMFLEGESPSEEKLKELIQKGTPKLSFLLFLTGTVFKNKGIPPLLDDVIDYVPSPLELEAIILVTDDGEDNLRAFSDKSLSLP